MDNPITYGIAGYKAPELLVDQWIDADGKTIEPITPVPHETDETDEK